MNPSESGVNFTIQSNSFLINNEYNLNKIIKSKKFDMNNYKPSIYSCNYDEIKSKIPLDLQHFIGNDLYIIGRFESLLFAISNSKHSAENYPTKTVYLKILIYLKFYKINQKNFASLVGVSQSSLSNYLNMASRPKKSWKSFENKIIKFFQENFLF